MIRHANHSQTAPALQPRFVSLLRGLTLVLCAMLTAALIATTDAKAAPAANDADAVASVLDQLGVTALIEQTPLILSAAIETETQFLGAKPQPANWRRDLEAQLKTAALQQSVLRFVRERASADTLKKAQQRLQQPLAKRVRYFDLAMMQPGAEKNLRAYVAASASTAAVAPTEAARRKVLAEIDAASASSRLMATLQSAIAMRVREAAGGGQRDAVLLSDEMAERQRYLAPLAVSYLAFDYRYLRDDELQDYRDLLRDDSVQWLLDISRQALIATLLGELTPPTKPPAPPQ